MAMKLNTGKISFPIEFDNGDKDCIYFNPNDPELFSRIINLEKQLNEKVGEIEDIKLTEDGLPQEESFINRFNSITTILKEELDFAFGSKISSVVFKHCSPFAIVNGEYFLMQFVKAIKPEIERCIKEAGTEMDKNISKHIDKYRN